MLMEENNQQACSQNPLNVADLKYCAVKSELLLRSNEVICAMCALCQWIHAVHAVCAYCAV